MPKPPEDKHTTSLEEARKYEEWRAREAGELEPPDFDEGDVEAVSDDRSIWDVPPILLDVDEPDTELGLVKPKPPRRDQW
jgi:hypothetical protein